MQFGDGRIISIVGLNGCGKSTLLKLISGLLKPYQGHVLLDGQDIRDIPVQTLAQRIAYLPQSRSIPDITAHAMVLHGRFPYIGYPRRYRREDLNIASHAMEQTGISHLADKHLSEISGGERQKVYIAMLLAQNTDYILLDEPTTYLDIKYQMEIMALIKELQIKGKTIIMVLHDLNMALRSSDICGVIHDGNLLAYASPKDIYESRVLDKVFEVKIVRNPIRENEDHYVVLSKI
jgi:iron complex transport system ATP-binding protein